MRWESDWWGITIITENDDDEFLLTALQEKLQQKAGHDIDVLGDTVRAGCYEDGEIEEIEDEETGRFSLVFHR